MHQALEPVALMVTVSAKPQYGPYVAHCPLAGVPLIEKEAVPLTTLKVSELWSLLLERLALQVQMVRLAQPGGESGGGYGHGGCGEGHGDEGGSGRRGGEGGGALGGDAGGTAAAARQSGMRPGRPEPGQIGFQK